MATDWTEKITAQERIELGIANCRCCLISTALKDCGKCKFNYAFDIFDIEKTLTVIEIPTSIGIDRIELV